MPASFPWPTCNSHQKRATSSDLVAYLTGRIAERAAIPKEVILLDKLPLTDIGKPDKAALRRDIIEVTFRSKLAEATGLSCQTGELQVSVRPHARQGSQLAITVAPRWLQSSTRS